MAEPDLLHALIGQDQHLITWWQMTARAFIVFAFGLVIIRLFGRRIFGRQNPLDIVIAIVIGSSLSRTLTGNARFVPTLCAMAVLVLLFWITDHVAARWPFFSWLTKGSPIVLTRNEKLDRSVMHRHGVGQGDVEEAVRTSGMRDTDDLGTAVLERNGKISAIRKS